MRRINHDIKLAVIQVAYPLAKRLAANPHLTAESYIVYFSQTAFNIRRYQDDRWINVWGNKVSYQDKHY